MKATLRLARMLVVLAAFGISAYQGHAIIGGSGGGTGGTISSGPPPGNPPPDPPLPSGPSDTNWIIFNRYCTDFLYTNYPINSCYDIGWGNGNGQCCDCKGMPVWSVSEPYINLWVKDQPLGYQPAKGPAVAFQLGYKMRENTAGMTTNEFSIGPYWNFSWLSYVRQNGTGFQVHLPEGGLLDYASLGAVEYQTYSVLTNISGGGYQLIFPDGRTNIYAMKATPGGNDRFYLTEQRDRVGNKLTFQYENQNTVPPVARLISVTDADGKANQLFYSTSGANTNLITAVVDRFGRTNQLFYDNRGWLSNIVDVVGINSSFRYDSNDWMTNLITPYGTNMFIATVDDTVGLFNALQVTDAGGGRHLWIYEGINASSYYWGPRQYPGLSTILPSDLNSADYRLSRWQMWTNIGGNMTLLFEQDFSPDGGTTAGQQTSYTYTNGQSRPWKVSRVLPDGNTWFVQTERNTQGTVTTNISSYTLTDNVTVGTRTNRFVYSADGFDMLASYGPDGTTNSHIEYLNHMPVSVTDATGEWIHYTYNDAGQVTGMTNTYGLFTTNSYYATPIDTNRLAMTITTAPGTLARTYSYTYTNGLVYISADERGNTVTNYWDDLGRITTTCDGLGTNIIVYSNLDIILTVDRMGFTNHFVYDAMRRMKDRYDALGRHTHYEYCSCGVLESITDANNQITRYEYDGAGRRTSETGPDNYTMNYYYDMAGRPYCTVDSSGVWNYSSFNNQGLVYAVSNVVGLVNYRQFDIYDRVIYSVDANNVAVTNTFDSAGRLLVTGTMANSAYNTYGYTPHVSGPTTITNALTNVTLYAYDAYGRKTAETNANGKVTRFTYDVDGALKTLIDGNDHKTTWNYDQFGRAISKMDDNDSFVYTNSYDADNRKLTHWTLAKGTNSYRYDAVGNLTNVIYPSSPSITNYYDAMNRLTRMQDAVGTNLFTYNAVGQITTEDGPWIYDMVGYTYQNRLRSSLYIENWIWTQTYGYDWANRLTNVTSQAGSFSYVYVQQRQTLIGQIILPGGGSIANQFDGLGRLTDTRYVNPDGAILNGHAYMLNNGNQRKRQTREGATGASTVDYDYDPLGEVISAIGKEANGTLRQQEQFKYGYDAAGNLTNRINNAFVQSFGVNELNELTGQTNTGTLTASGNTSSGATNVSVSVNGGASQTALRYADLTWALPGVTPVNGLNTFSSLAQTAAGETATNIVTLNVPSTNGFAYDQNGNLTWDGQKRMDYDDENQLSAVTITNQLRKEYVYDGLRRLRIIKEYAPNGIGWTKTNEFHFIYDGFVIFQIRDGSNNLKLTFTRGLDLSGTLQGAGGTGGLLAMTDHTQSNPMLVNCFYHCDGNGNVTALVTTNGLIVGSAIYSPFGEILSMNGPVADANPFWFSSQFYDPGTGFLHYLYRVYSPNLQRWLNKDPIGEMGGVNLYQFVGNRPVVSTDAYGLLSLRIDPPTLGPGPGMGNDGENCQKLQQWKNNLEEAIRRLEKDPVGDFIKLQEYEDQLATAIMMLKRNNCGGGNDNGGGGGGAPPVLSPSRPPSVVEPVFNPCLNRQRQPYYQPTYNTYNAFMPGFTQQEYITLWGLTVIGGSAVIWVIAAEPFKPAP